MTRPERNSRLAILVGCALLLIGMALALLAFCTPAGAAPIPQRGNRLLDALEREYGLPAGLLLAVRQIETGGRNVTATGRGRGGLGADVGEWQIHVPDWRSDAGSRAWWYLRQSPVNAAVAAFLLAHSRDRCAASVGRPEACLRCRFALYNAKSMTWCTRLRAAMNGGNS